MLKTSRAYIRQAVIVDASPMTRIASTVLGRARRVLDGVFRRPAAPVPKPNLVVAKPPVGIVASALNGVYRGGFVSKFVAKSHPSELVTAARNRYGFRLVTRSFGTGQGGNAFKGLGQKLSTFAFVAVGVAVGVDQDEMCRRVGFDSVYSNILTLCKDQKDVSFERCTADIEPGLHVCNEFSLNMRMNEQETGESFVLVRNPSCASLNSNLSYDSDITVLSDLERQEEFDQLLEDEVIFVYKENNISDLVEQDTSLMSDSNLSYDSDITVLSDLERQEEFNQLLEDEEIFVCKENNISDLVEQDTSLMSDDRERPSVIAELEWALSVVQAQGIQLFDLRRQLIHCNKMLKQWGQDNLDQSDPSNTFDCDVEEEEEKVTDCDGGLTWVFAAVDRQKRQLDALRHAMTDRHNKLCILQRKAVTQQCMEQNSAQSLKEWEYHESGGQLSDSCGYCKRDACCGPGLVYEEFNP